MTFSFALKNGELKILLPNNIDTTNAQQVEDSIGGILKEQTDFQSLVLDAQNLEYKIGRASCRERVLW